MQSEWNLAKAYCPIELSTSFRNPRNVREPQLNSWLSGVIGTFMGRDALRLAVNNLDLAPSDTVLLPGYLCIEVLKPFLPKCRVKYYDVCPDTSIDPWMLEQLLKRYGSKLVLFINYFGFLQPHRGDIKKLCTRQNALLIEDCAHSLLTAGSGETGDWVIYSYRKILPIPDGGGLRTNESTEQPHPCFLPKIYSNLLSVLIQIKSILKVRTCALNRTVLASRGRQNAPTLGTRRFLPMSSFAKNRLKRLDYAAITARRREDFQFWLDWTHKRPEITPIFDSLPAGVCPMGFPVLLRDRGKLKSRLERVGLLVRTHWHLPPSVGPEFVNCHYLASRSLTLPLYPEFSRRAREGVAGITS